VARTLRRFLARLRSVLIRRLLSLWKLATKELITPHLAAFNKWKPRKGDTLIILDDAFPHIGTGFRILEFNEYLRVFPKSMIYTTLANFANFKDEYIQYYPEYSSRILAFSPDDSLDCRLVYIAFLHNASAFLPVIESFKVPFILELYPGGLFRLGEEESDRLLAQVCESKMLRKIIVTQPITYSYLIDKKFCDKEKLAYIHGGVINVPQNIPQKQLYPRDKKTFDICFTAYKYMPLGKDKGYDIFIQVAKQLAKRSSCFRFHVVGTFERSDIDVSEIDSQIYFYGPKPMDFFIGYYMDKDLILSPNRPFVLEKGAFDGIPTGSVLEAGACGVAMFCTDLLKLTEGVFRDEDEIIIIDLESESIVNKVWQYYQDPEKLYGIARRGRTAISKNYRKKRQMGSRIRTIRTVLRELRVRKEPMSLL
jgi:glycosyltransferase involved in cell wall biosynthesis